MSRRTEGWLWTLFFTVLTVLTITPVMAPYGKTGPWIMGLPYTVFWWLLSTVVLIAGFVALELLSFSRWREEDEGE